MEDKEPAPYSLDMARRDIVALNNERLAQLNRILATEAIIKAIISELDLPALRNLEESYDSRVIHAMGHLQPSQQRPHLWEPYLEKIREVIALRHKSQPGTEP